MPSAYRQHKPYLGAHSTRPSKTGSDQIDGLVIFRAEVNDEIIDVEIPFEGASGPEDAVQKASPTLFEAATMWQKQAEIYSRVDLSLDVFAEAEIDEPANVGSFSTRILPISGFLLGICIALVGIVKLFEARYGPSHVDEYGALLALVFLISILTSFGAGSLASSLRMTCERVAGVSFVSGLVGLTFVSLFFAYDIV